MNEQPEEPAIILEIEKEHGPEIATELKTHLQAGSQPTTLAETIVKEEPPEPVPEKEERKSTDMRSLIAEMTVPQKIKAAMFGNATCRKLLILDANRMIQECVLNNPKIMPNEIEDFAKNTNVDAQVLRSIASKSVWMRTYKVKQLLVFNPKCPPDLSLKWLRFLNMGDVKNLARSKNVPQVLQLAAKKKLNDEVNK